MRADGSSRADDERLHRAAVAKARLLVLGVQLSVADAHPGRAARRAQPGLHDVCRERAARCVRASSARRATWRWRSSAADYILNELYRTDGRDRRVQLPVAVDEARIHNANLLAAALLSRVARLTGDGTVARARAQGRPVSGPASGPTGRGRTARATPSVGRQFSHRLQPVAPCATSAASIATTEFERSRSRASTSTGALLSRGRRRPILSRPHVSDRHPLRGAERHHAAGVRRSCIRRQATGARRCWTGR